MAAVLGQNASYQKQVKFENAALAASEMRMMKATGFAWTTGEILVTARVGGFTTTMQRTGYDDRTAMGLGNIQLVTPVLTHWVGASPGDHTAQIGVLKLHFVPEPGAGLLLAAGAVALQLLHRAVRRGGCA